MSGSIRACSRRSVEVIPTVRIAPGLRALVADRDARSDLTGKELRKLTARAQIGPLKPKFTGQTT